MSRDYERIERIQKAIQEAGWDALVCALPTNVLMISGYWPVVGTSVAIITREGRIGLAVPEDERDLAERGWADELETFKAGTLEEIIMPASGARAALAKLAGKLKVSRAVGHECKSFYEPASYAAMHFYCGTLSDIIAEAMAVPLVAADDLLMQLRAVKTPRELQCIRIACQTAQDAFQGGAKRLRAGMAEMEAAEAFHSLLRASVIRHADLERADGFFYCMSGPNSAQAYAAYQRSRKRKLDQGDLVLIHCNSYANGYWTDITRTFAMGPPDERQRDMYDALFAALRDAFDAVKPGARTSEVDGAARATLRERGFGREFKHPAGHGVGFAAINHNASPRIHPASTEVLETGMVFNLEPGIYFEGYGGMRHCDMVAVTQTGVETLTPFLSTSDELVVDVASKHSNKS